MLLVILNVERFLERFNKHNCNKQIKTFGFGTVIKRKVRNYMLTGKATTVLLTVGLVKKT